MDKDTPETAEVEPETKTETAPSAKAPKNRILEKVASEKNESPKTPLTPTR